jgi:hypothetical protein
VNVTMVDRFTRASGKHSRPQRGTMRAYLPTANRKPAAPRAGTDSVEPQHGQSPGYDPAGGSDWDRLCSGSGSGFLNPGLLSLSRNAPDGAFIFPVLGPPPEPVHYANFKQGCASGMPILAVLSCGANSGVPPETRIPKAGSF